MAWPCLSCAPGLPCCCLSLCPSLSLLFGFHQFLDCFRESNWQLMLWIHTHVFKLYQLKRKRVRLLFQGFTPCTLQGLLKGQRCLSQTSIWTSCHQKPESFRHAPLLGMSLSCDFLKCQPHTFTLKQHQMRSSLSRRPLSHDSVLNPDPSRAQSLDTRMDFKSFMFWPSLKSIDPIPC